MKVFVAHLIMRAFIPEQSANMNDKKMSDASEWDGKSLKERLEQLVPDTAAVAADFHPYRPMAAAGICPSLELDRAIVDDLHLERLSASTVIKAEPCVYRDAVLPYPLAA